MCGIAGYLHFKNPIEDSSIIRSMTNRMKHRGPDAEGFHIDRNIALGHRRLSIIDLSEKANQPIFDASGRYCIVFNGEIYNYAELKSQLPDYPFATNGDTEVVLAAYIQWGVSALTRLKGMFAFAIWDAKSRELFITRDRLGVKPVYFARTDTHFVFASEIRAILGSGLVARKINRNALADFLLYQSFQSPDTLVENIQELPAGYYALVSDSKFEQKSYWDITNLPDIEIGNNESINRRVKELLIQSVERRMVSDVPVAAFLSGGIDSSVVVGLMAQVSSIPETFNISFDDVEFDESKYASIIAKKFNTRHHELRLGSEDFLQELPNALNAMDSPSGDGVNTYVVSKAIRKQGIKVALSGVGGDELFAGYPIFKQYESLQQRSWLWKSTGFIRKLAALTLRSEDIRKQRTADLLRLSDCSIFKVYPILRQVNSNHTLDDLLKSTTRISQLQQTLIDKQSAIEKFPAFSQVSIAEYLCYTKQTLLRDTDQMSMAVSLEVREPFFDHELIEYVLKLPDIYKKGNFPKSLLLRATGDLIPTEIYDRPKKGFVFPWNKWFRNELRSYCDSRMSSLCERDLFISSGVKRCWKDFLEQKNSIGWTNILMLVTLENYIEAHHLE